MEKTKEATDKESQDVKVRNQGHVNGFILLTWNCVTRVLHHDNAPSHTALTVKQILAKTATIILEYLIYLLQNIQRSLLGYYIVNELEVERRFSELPCN